MNPRPSGYEPDELPDCSTPRRYVPDMIPPTSSVAKGTGVDDRVVAADNAHMETEDKATRRLTLDDVERRMEVGRGRLIAAGFTERNNEARLRWKEQRGIDTTVERKILALENSD